MAMTKGYTGMTDTTKLPLVFVLSICPRNSENTRKTVVENHSISLIFQKIMSEAGNFIFQMSVRSNKSEVSVRSNKNPIPIKSACAQISERAKNLDSKKRALK